jgi:hypothetical protein
MVKKHTEISDTFKVVVDELACHPRLGGYIDTSIPTPKVFRGSGKIRLIILGQDPTVKNASARQEITTVLNLNKSGNLTHYLRRVCTFLDIKLDTEV